MWKCRCMTSHGWVFDGWMGHQGQFFPIQRELLFIFDKITYYLCLICNGRKKEKERDREMKLPHRGKCCQGKASIYFFFGLLFFLFVCLRFRHFFPMKFFLTKITCPRTKNLPVEMFLHQRCFQKTHWFMLKSLSEWHSIR